VSLYGEALRLRSRHGLSWYDALILTSALEGECGTLYSKDFQHRRAFGSLQNPFAEI
jgi:predicted nucleic acid-binding protein